MPASLIWESWINSPRGCEEHKGTSAGKMFVCKTTHERKQCITLMGKTIKLTVQEDTIELTVDKESCLQSNCVPVCSMSNESSWHASGLPNYLHIYTICSHLQQSSLPQEQQRCLNVFYYFYFLIKLLCLQVHKLVFLSHNHFTVFQCTEAVSSMYLHNPTIPSSLLL